MKKIGFGICVMIGVLAGCSRGSDGVAVRNGPQAVHPSSTVQAQMGTAVSPVAQYSAGTQGDSCGAAQYQSLVGGPSSATFGLQIPGDSRHYGRSERVATDTPSRLNFVHSGSAVDAVVNPRSTVTRVFCG